MLVAWVTIAVIALIIDLTTSSFLFVWFTMGGIAAIISYTLGYSLKIQIITFTGVSAFLMAFGYPLAKKTIKKTVPRTPIMEENYIGRQIVIEEDVEYKTIIKLDGIYWTIKNQGEKIKKGDRIEITGIEGNKLLVKKV